MKTEMEESIFPFERLIYSEKDLLDKLWAMPEGNCSFDFSKVRKFPFWVTIDVKGNDWSMKQ